QFEITRTGGEIIMNKAIQDFKNAIFFLERLTSGQRKLVYLGGIVVLMVGAILLGAPSTGKEGSGGKLAQLRAQHQLGESTLGKVDPSSATMNLVLLGLRGVAANVLWMEHEELNKTKNWARMEDTVRSIVTLQPHFLQVWRYHGWNLAYNVSSQWDDVRDRFFWVKKGTKFTLEGAQKNQNYAELPWDVGRLVGHKIGRSDEWRFFRKYFVKDPDPQPGWGGRLSDPDINPDRRDDNYLVAYDRYTDANKIEAKIFDERGKGQHQMMRELFRHYPARSLFDMADALHREGTFGEVSKTAWDDAYKEWVTKYGKEVFLVESGGGFYWLNREEGDIEKMIALDKKAGYEVSPTEKQRWIDARKKVTNYPYWRSRAVLERDDLMVQAHRELFDGRQLYKAGRYDWTSEGPPVSVQKLRSGLEKFEEMFKRLREKEESEGDLSEDEKAQQLLTEDDNLVEEAMLALMYYHKAHELAERELPKDYPMKDLWEKNQDLMPTIEREFRRDLGGLANN
ncbi:MAG: hypothetical protein KDA84_18590, partial [Planctomycetaceae bacterium]|nr:hypothetical protein [Planctomycetaceae bacterium]